MGTCGSVRAARDAKRVAARVIILARNSGFSSLCLFHCVQQNQAMTMPVCLRYLLADNNAALLFRNVFQLTVLHLPPLLTSDSVGTSADPSLIKARAKRRKLNNAMEASPGPR